MTDGTSQQSADTIQVNTGFAFGGGFYPEQQAD